MNWKYLRNLSFIDTRARFVNKQQYNCRLLDIGSSDGQTLNHFYELRPDIYFYALDILGKPEHYPPNTEFYRCNVENTKFPWSDNYFDSITCMHLIEHLNDTTNLFKEITRVLKPGGMIYFEIPSIKSIILDSPKKKLLGSFTLNFFDDPTHKNFLSIGHIANLSIKNNLEIEFSGTSRNYIFAFIYILLFFTPLSRKKLISKVHFLGWSSYLICRKRK